MAKANYDLPNETIKKVAELSGAKTKREAIIVALEDFIRRKKIEKMMNMSGELNLNWTQKSLKKYRGK